MGRVILPIYTPLYLPNGKEIAVISTTKGTIRVKLDGKNAPLTVGNFIELSKRGFYENLKFHAYKADSVILGGCPVTRKLGSAQVSAGVRGIIRGVHPGTGDARYTIKDEYADNPNNYHERGSICLAHKSDPDSGSCQFYFSLSKQPEFDDKFTVFGHTTEGLETVLALRIGDTIVNIKIEEADEEKLKAAVSQATPTPESSASKVADAL